MTDVIVEVVVPSLPLIVETVVPEAPLEVELGVPGPPGPQGLPGPAGGLVMAFTATTPIGGHRMLALNAANEVVYASADVPGDAVRIIGMSLNAAVAGGALSVQRAGEVEESSWNWVVTLPVYLGLNGLLTQIPPASPLADFSLIVGFPTAATRLFLAVREPIILT